MSIASEIIRLKSELPQGVRLVAVSKFHTTAEIMEAYGTGHRMFGENRPQEFAAKAETLPKDIEWHFIGHLQTNKLKLVLPHASLVESVDSMHLLEQISLWGDGHSLKTNILLEMHLGSEETKGGLSEEEIWGIVSHIGDYPGVSLKGLMGMATNTDDETVIREDFGRIARLHAGICGRHPELSDFRELSIGMSGDWRIALDYGATIVRIGTAIFGARQS